MDKRSQTNLYIKQIRRGEYSAVESLYRLIGNDLYFRAFHYTKDSSAADDLMQDFWLNIDVYCKKIAVVSHGYAYLMRCFDNLCKDRLRKEKTERAHLTDLDIEQFESLMATDEELDLRQRLLRHSFDKAASKMTDLQKKVFVMLKYGYPIRRIAEDVGLSKSSVDRVKKEVFLIVREVLIEDGWDKDDD